MNLDLNKLGALQRRVLEILWRRGKTTVKEVLDELNDQSDTKLAYTTILTTLQKLEKVGWIDHERGGERLRTYVYRAKMSRSAAIGASLNGMAKNYFEGNKVLLFRHLLDEIGLSQVDTHNLLQLVDRTNPKMNL